MKNTIKLPSPEPPPIPTHVPNNILLSPTKKKLLTEIFQFLYRLYKGCPDLVEVLNFPICKISKFFQKPGYETFP